MTKFADQWEPNGPFGIVTDSNMSGGYRVVTDDTDKTNITVLPPERQKVGMVVYVSSTGKTWRLTTVGVRNPGTESYSAEPVFEEEGGGGIGDLVVGGTPGSVLYIDNDGKLAQSTAGLQFSASTNTLTVGTGIVVGGLDGSSNSGLIRAPDMTSASANAAGNELRLMGGASTGNAAGGVISLRVSPAGAAGSTVNTQTTRVRITSTNVELNGPVLFDVGSRTEPSITFDADTGTGIWHEASGVLAMSVSGVFAPEQVFRISNDQEGGLLNRVTMILGRQAVTTSDRRYSYAQIRLPSRSGTADLPGGDLRLVPGVGTGTGQTGKIEFYAGRPWASSSVTPHFEIAALTIDGGTFDAPLSITTSAATLTFNNQTNVGLANINIGTQATESGKFKTVTIGNDGAAGSSTQINIASAVPGASNIDIGNTSSNVEIRGTPISIIGPADAASTTNISAQVATTGTKTVNIGGGSTGGATAINIGTGSGGANHTRTILVGTSGSITDRIRVGVADGLSVLQPVGDSKGLLAGPAVFTRYGATTPLGTDDANPTTLTNFNRKVVDGYYRFEIVLFYNFTVSAGSTNYFNYVKLRLHLNDPGATATIAEADFSVVSYANRGGSTASTVTHALLAQGGSDTTDYLGGALFDAENPPADATQGGFMKVEGVMYIDGTAGTVYELQVQAVTDRVNLGGNAGTGTISIRPGSFFSLRKQEVSGFT